MIRKPPQRRKMTVPLLSALLLILSIGCGQEETPKKEDEGKAYNGYTPSPSSLGQYQPQYADPNLGRIGNVAFQPQPLTIISDLDDTLKITNSNSTLSSIFNAIGSRKGFAGMRELIISMVQNAQQAGGGGFFIVTGSPGLIGSQVQDFFSSQSYPPPTQIFLKDGRFGDDTAQHKLGAIQTILQSSQNPVLFIGDDTQYDAQVYAQITGAIGQRALGTYIRVVSGQGVASPGQIPFMTAFHMATHEYLQGRLSRDQILQVGQAVLSTNDHELVVPDFARCASTPVGNIQADTQLAQMAQQIEQLLAQICPR